MLLQKGDLVTELRGNGETVDIYKITSVGKHTAYSERSWYKFVREYTEGGNIIEREPRSSYKRIFVIANPIHTKEKAVRDLINKLSQTIRHKMSNATVEQLQKIVEVLENANNVIESK